MNEKTDLRPGENETLRDRFTVFTVAYTVKKNLDHTIFTTYNF